MPSGFDYSKWDKLELSDDEDDHPGAKFIEENTLRRIKRESHERQEAERAAKVAELEKTIEAETEKLNELTEKYYRKFPRSFDDAWPLPAQRATDVTLRQFLQDHTDKEPEAIVKLAKEQLQVELDPVSKGWFS